MLHYQNDGVSGEKSGFRKQCASVVVRGKKADKEHATTFQNF